MRFGSYLESQRVPEWADSYLDYGKLKGMIEALAKTEAALDDDRVTSLTAKPTTGNRGKFDGRDISEADFFTALEAEMAKVDAFTHEQLTGIRSRAEKLEATVGFGGSGSNAISEARREEAKNEAKLLGDEFLKIEKFANLNYLGFHKILKKHDKQLPTPCRRFYLTRLHNQRWVKHDYSKLFVELSKIHSILRGDASGEDDGAGAQNFVRTTTKYWVRTENISKVKHVVLQNLPVFQHNQDALPGDSQFCSSVYFDNTQMELYHGRLDKTPNAIAIRFRWYATEVPELVFVERKTHRDSWTGEVSVKERFTLHEKQVMPFLRGEFTVEDKAAEMRAKNKSEADIENMRQLFSEIYQQIESKQLRPTMRTVYNRVAYQIPFDATVRISLDSNLTMIAENPKVGPDCATEKRWYRNPYIPLPPTEITRFPHAVLEVKLSLKEGQEAPKWVRDLIEGGMCTQVHKFSKFIHGCATLLPEQVQAFPYWIDDLSIRPSILRSQPMPQRRSLMDGKKGNRQPSFQSPYEPLQLMERKPSVVLESSSGTGAPKLGGEREPLTRELASKPRKTPMKIEPKVFFANERTLMSWLNMALTLGALAATLLGYSASLVSGAQASGRSSTGLGPHMMGFILLPIAMLFAAYAYITYISRRKYLRLRIDQGAFFDETGPMLLGVCLIIALSGIFVAKLPQ